jgi:hypothetical protein
MNWDGCVRNNFSPLERYATRVRGRIEKNTKNFHLVMSSAPKYEPVISEIGSKSPKHLNSS